MSLPVRLATRADVPAIVAMLADDTLGATREQLTDPLPAVYYEAFEAVDADPNQELLVIDRDGAILGCLQLSLLRGLSRRGATLTCST